MHLSAAKVALVLAFVSAQVGAIPAPSPQERGVGSGSHHGGADHPYGGNWKGGTGGMVGGHPGDKDGLHGGPGRMDGNGNGNGKGNGNQGDGGFRGKHGPGRDEDDDLARRDLGDGDKFRHGPPPSNGGGSGFHRGGVEYGRKPAGTGHGPIPEEEFDDEASAHLDRRHDYIKDPLAGWKWWQKQPAYGKIPTGNPNAGVIDMKDDPIMDRIPQRKKRDGDEDAAGSNSNEKRSYRQQEDRFSPDRTPPEPLDHTFWRDFKNAKPGKMIPKEH